MDRLSTVGVGKLEYLLVRSQTLVDITAGGKALNFTFEGQNLSANDVSYIRIAGDYTSRSDRTPVILADTASQITLNEIFFKDPLAVANPNRKSTRLNSSHANISYAV